MTHASRPLTTKDWGLDRLLRVLFLLGAKRRNARGRSTPSGIASRSQGVGPSSQDAAKPWRHRPVTRRLSTGQKARGASGSCTRTMTRSAHAIPIRPPSEASTALADGLSRRIRRIKCIRSDPEDPTCEACRSRHINCRSFDGRFAYELTPGWQAPTLGMAAHATRYRFSLCRTDQTSEQAGSLGAAKRSMPSSPPLELLHRRLGNPSTPT